MADAEIDLDERGSGHPGLSVALRTGALNVLEVRLRNRILIAAPMGRALHDRSWVPIQVAHEDAYGLRVVLGDAVVVANLSLPEYNPMPSWRMAIAARTPDSSAIAADADAYLVHDLRLSSGLLLRRAVGLHGPSSVAMPPIPCRTPRGAS